MSASWDIQKAIYDAIEHTPYITGVFDEPPTNQEYPYIVIGNMTEVSSNRHGSLGYENTIVLSIQTKPGAAGFKPAKEILNEVNSRINMVELSLGNFTMVKCHMENAESLRDDELRRIEARYRVIAH